MDGEPGRRSRRLHAEVEALTGGPVVLPLTYRNLLTSPVSLCRDVVFGRDLEMPLMASVSAREMALRATALARTRAHRRSSTGSHDGANHRLEPAGATRKLRPAQGLDGSWSRGAVTIADSTAIIGVAVVWAICGVVSSLIWQHRGGSPVSGFLIGALAGVFGLVYVTIASPRTAAVVWNPAAAADREIQVAIPILIAGHRLHLHLHLPEPPPPPRGLVTRAITFCPSQSPLGNHPVTRSVPKDCLEVAADRQFASLRRPRSSPRR